MNKRSLFFSLLALLTASRISAEPVTFDIVESESLVTISGSVATFTISQQAAGSLVTRYAGTIAADLTGSTIRFTGRSLIDAKTNGVWQPAPGGGTSSNPGSGPADYGGQANAGFATLKGAVREVLLDVTNSAPLTLTNGTSFDASALTFLFPPNAASAFDYNAGALGRGTKKFGGLLTNRVSVAGTLTQNAGQQRLTIAVETDIKFTVINQNDSTIHLSGQLVATRGGGPTFTTIAFGTNNVLSITVEGTGAQPVLESSTDLINWAPRTANVETSGSTRTYRVQPQGTLEFFRIRQ